MTEGTPTTPTGERPLPPGHCPMGCPESLLYVRYRTALRAIVNGVSVSEAELKEIAQEALNG